MRPALDAGWRRCSPSSAQQDRPPAGRRRRWSATIGELGPAAARKLTPGLIARQRTSAEGQEGLTAFLEKRPPEWTR